MLRFYRYLLSAALLTCFAVLASAQEYPLTLQNKFGTTVINKQPQRVASIDFSGADDLLAMGVQPVAIRRWQGKSASGLWPWAAPLLKSKPVIIGRTIDAEALAASKPDIIIALWSGISQQEYDQLSKIAPVVAVPKGTGDYAMRWEDRAKIAGKAVGKTAEAKALVAALKQKMQAIAAAHPSWQGKTAAVGYDWFGKIGGYAADDIRMQTLMALGFKPIPGLQALATPGKFNIDLSPETIDKLDGDLLLWVTHGNEADIRKTAGRQLLNVVKNRHEIILNAEQTAAFSYGSLLSIPYLLDKLVPEIEQTLTN